MHLVEFNYSYLPKTFRGMLTLLLMTSLTSPSSLYKKTLSREMLKQKNNHMLLDRIKEGKIYFC